MTFTVDHSLPVVVICNISETFYPFLSRADAPNDLVSGEQYRGDRALVWCGDPKLVITSLPIPHYQLLIQQAQYPGTVYAAPQRATADLSHDILRDAALLQRVIDYASEAHVLQLIPYAATEQFYDLVDALRRDHGLTVLLPESPERDHLWVRDYIDSKNGYRVLVSRWLPNADDLLLPGFVCPTYEEAASAAYWFLQRDQGCVVKADDGENGFGNVRVLPGEFDAPAPLEAHLRANPLLGRTPLTVEALVTGERLLSPSLEVYVPPANQGEPFITYTSDQLFNGFGNFCGVLVSRELTQTHWYALLAESGLIIARRLQAMGYVGHFDLDCIVDDDDNLCLLEINPRRTGGTHVHDFGLHLFGANYLDRVSMISNDSLPSGAISDYEELVTVIEPFLYPIDGEPRGMIPMVTSALADREFGGVFAGRNTADALAIFEGVQAAVAAYIPVPAT